jgi:hypothetical protein
MMDDFPILPEPEGSLLFADDIECHVHGKEAEAKLSPYHDRVLEWSRKWRLKFAGPKSSLVTFTRQKRK